MRGKNIKITVFYPSPRALAYVNMCDFANVWVSRVKMKMNNYCQAQESGKKKKFSIFSLFACVVLIAIPSHARNRQLMRCVKFETK